jgi:O-methyltransferase involved in polyketide biosynthesis
MLHAAIKWLLYLKCLNQWCDKVEKTNPKAIAESLSPLSRTALSVLYGRVTNANLLRDPYSDPLGEKILRTLNYTQEPSFQGVFIAVAPIRTKIIDEMVAKFTITNGNNIMVAELGCGLSTRFERLADKKAISPENVVWVNVDLPDMIALRKELWGMVSPATADLQKLSPGSVFERGWIEFAKAHSRGINLILAEGLLGYFEPDKINLFFDRLRDAFKGGEIILTTVHPMHKELERNPNSTKHKHSWFARSGSEVANMAGFELLEERHFFAPEYLNEDKVPKEVMTFIREMPPMYTGAVRLRIK